MNNEAERREAPIGLVIAAFAAVYVIWGSTYLAIRYALEGLPPFFLAGGRFVVAGAAMFVLTRRRYSAALTRANWVGAGLIGCLMLVGGNGLVCWSEQYVPSGLAAVVIATAPLWFASFDWLLYAGPRPGGRVVVGIVVGLLGIVVLIGPGSLGGDRVHLGGAGALVLACLFWALGSLQSRRMSLPSSPFVTTAMEMLVAGFVLLAISGLFGEWKRVDLAGVSGKAWLSVAYLIVFGSGVGLSAYVWLLRVSTPARVSTYAYVNPVIAVLLGAWLAEEAVSGRAWMAMGLILAAVVTITTAKSRPVSVDKAKTKRCCPPMVRPLPVLEPEKATCP